MGLLLFAIIFAFLNLDIFMHARTQLCFNGCRNTSTYSRTVREFMDKFDSEASLEKKRKCLSKKNSKF